ncbi:unnamed protein product [Rhizoctonia solani]|nr:unnamed protein product [Rhizoctonia solani]
MSRTEPAEQPGLSSVTPKICPLPNPGNGSGSGPGSPTNLPEPRPRNFRLSTPELSEGQARNLTPGSSGPRGGTVSTRKLYLCESFWKIPRNTVGSKPGLFINALSRLPENGGTTDYYITPSEIEDLARENPEGTVQNSESHRRFAETYFGSLGHLFLTQGKAHRDSGEEEEPDVMGSASGNTDHPRPLDFVRISKGKAKIPGSM